MNEAGRDDFAELDSLTPNPERAPVRLGHYVLLHKLGRGGMGIVYAAYDERLDRRVAIKLLRARGRKRARLRLKREAQALARLSHPNVVQIHDVGEFEKRPFLVMELIDGATLGEWRTERRRSRAEILEVFLAAGRGLAAAHQQGLIHRDFKPDNVMIRHDGRVVVMDFGLARGDERSDSPPVDDLELTDSGEISGEDSPAPDSDGDRSASTGESSQSGPGPRSSELARPLTVAGAIMGTPGYMAPEQLFGGDVREHCDQFSFCAALWEALYDQRPFRGRHLEAYGRSLLRDQPRVPETSDVPVWLRKLLERGLARDPDDRWPSMNTLLDALQRDPTERRRRFVLVAGLLSCAGLAAAGLHLANQRERDRLDQERADQIASCSAEGEAIAADWNDERSVELAQAFARTGHPFATSAWQHTRPWLDRYASEWSVLRTQICVEATVERSRSAESQATVNDCLDEGRLAFVGMLDVLSDLAAEDAQMVSSATAAAAQLSSPTSCSDESLLRHHRRPPPELRDKITELRTRLERARARSYANDNERARDEAQAVLAEATAIAWSPLLVQAGTLVAFLQFRLSKFDEARLAAEQAVLTAAANDDGLGLVLATAELAAALTGLARYDEAKRWALLAKAQVERLELGGTYHEAQVLTRLSALLSQTGAHAEALPYQQRALAVYEAVLGPEHPTIPMVLLNLGITQDGLGDSHAALRSFNRGIEISKAVQGPEHMNLGYLHNSVGTTLKSMGELEGALAAYQRALAIWKATHAEDHPVVGAVLGNIGALLCERNQCEEALALHRRALETLVAARGPQHPSVAVAHVRIGTALLALRRYDESLEHHRIAQESLEASKGPEHHNVQAIRINIAETARRRGRPAEAVEQLRAILEVFERTQGPTHYIRGTLVQLGLALLDTGDLAAAREQLERALSLLEKDAPDIEHAEVLSALALVLTAAGEQPRAGELTDEVRARYRASGEFGARGLAEFEAKLQTLTR
ncbi:MAG TPA: serine/threonine-protein kinase [Enhygromyxa sp.]|nr:serine/threonine-protein kinase [Enhygromyxa sp.]